MVYFERKSMKEKNKLKKQKQFYKKNFADIGTIRVFEIIQDKTLSTTLWKMVGKEVWKHWNFCKIYYVEVI